MTFCGEFSITAYNKRLGRDIRSIRKLRGLRQCVRDCVDRGQCKAVNYHRDSLQCQLLGDSTTDLSDLMDDDSFMFIDIASQRTVFSSCNVSCTRGVCVKLSSEIDYCSVPRCPLTFRYSSQLNFCYISVDSGKKFADAQAYCETLGCRLAIPRTMDHIMFLNSEFSNGYMNNNKYRIGGQWNTEAGEWRWINGNAVFDSVNLNLTDFQISSNDGDLMWDCDSDLRQINTGNGEKFLCEKVL
ncbi:uncharacterized protein LOC134258984 [Saccostrea cucullata]|uniref:uncharacterized protein LOC134258984 n=1 Tax=Saccostrea cuccullata TaxID=36930 RepID=UPI002ED1A90B